MREGWGNRIVLPGGWFSCINMRSFPTCKEHLLVIPPVLWARTGQRVASRLSRMRWMRYPRRYQGSHFSIRLVQNISASYSELWHRDPGSSRNMEMTSDSDSEVVPVAKSVTSWQWPANLHHAVLRSIIYFFSLWAWRGTSAAGPSFWKL